jgi:Bacterial protein of unknown function (DUF899)
MATTCSSAMATRCFAPTSSTGAATRRATWSYLGTTPFGRQETWEDSPEGYPQTPPHKWWNWHDSYDAEASPNPKWLEVSDVGEATFRKHDPAAKACTCSLRAFQCHLG